MREWFNPIGEFLSKLTLICLALLQRHVGIKSQDCVALPLVRPAYLSSVHTLGRVGGFFNVPYLDDKCDQ